MKKYLLVYILAQFIFQSCAMSKIGKEYTSVCTLYHIYPRVIISLNADSSFAYKIALLDEKVTGRWYVDKGKLILESEYFTDNYIAKMIDVRRAEILAKDDTLLENFFTKEYIKNSIPAYKYTHYPQKDIFLIKRDVLIPIDSNGGRKYCELQKTK